jgi:hypothetical protein
MARMLKNRGHGQNTRFVLEKADEAKTWNAVGIGFLRVPNCEAAIQAFQAASGSSPKELAYKVNQALALKAFGDNPPPNPKDPIDPLRWKPDHVAQCGGVLMQAATSIDDPSREKLGQELALAAAGAFWAGYRPVEAGTAVMVAHDKFHLEEKETQRWRGAIIDWSGRLDLAAPYYKTAVEMKHREAFKMEVRLERLQSENRR